MFYFAYGVNMNHTGMKARCPESRFIGPASLEDHVLIFDGQSLLRPGGTANIIRSRGDRVWGALFEISEADLVNLDAFERYPTSYQRRNVSVQDNLEKAYTAIVYYRTEQQRSSPGESYLNEVIAGAEDSNLPRECISLLKEARKN